MFFFRKSKLFILISFIIFILKILYFFAFKFLLLSFLMRGEYLYFGFTKKASKGKKKYAAFPFPVVSYAQPRKKTSILLAKPSFHGFLLRLVVSLKSTKKTLKEGKRVVIFSFVCFPFFLRVLFQGIQAAAPRIFSRVFLRVVSLKKPRRF